MMLYSEGALFRIRDGYATYEIYVGDGKWEVYKGKTNLFTDARPITDKGVKALMETIDAERK